MNEKGSSLRAFAPQRAAGVPVPKARGVWTNTSALLRWGRGDLPVRRRAGTARTQFPASPAFRGASAQSGLPYSPASKSLALRDSPEPPKSPQTPSDSPGPSLKSGGRREAASSPAPGPPPPSFSPGCGGRQRCQRAQPTAANPGSGKRGSAPRGRGEPAPGRTGGRGGGAREGAEGRGAEEGPEGRGEERRGGDAQAKGRGAEATSGADRGGGGGG